jgi:mannose/fructose-specific phosphotransferase system component IIA
MSERPPLAGVLLGHGDLPAGMVDAVRHITGCDPDALVPVSNRGMSPDALAAAVCDAIGEGPCIVFTDLQGGSCGFIARRLLQGRPEMVVVSGVNLPLLIEFVMNRNLPSGELVPRLLTKGRAAMGCAPADLEGHEHRPVSN